MGDLKLYDNLFFNIAGSLLRLEDGLMPPLAFINPIRRWLLELGLIKAGLRVPVPLKLLSLLLISGFGLGLKIA